MGLFQNLLETYEKCSAVVGIVQTDVYGNANEKKTLLPIFHMTFKSAICVTLDNQGKFIRATRDRKETTIIIPCTESSFGRSRNIAPHPLCDQLDYVGGFNADKTTAFLTQLDSWKGNCESLSAIRTYVSSKIMINDLVNNAIFKDNEYQEEKDASGKNLDAEKIRKIGVRFAIQFPGSIVNAWESSELRNAWISYIKTGPKTSVEIFDYLSGEIVRKLATQHPKNINSLTGNAKLLSCNDTSNFTFRGRFAKQKDAIIVDYAQSQKMHQMLRWLIANYGYAVDSQVIVTWAVDSDTEVKAKAQDNSYDLFGELKTAKTDADVFSEVNAQLYADYAKKLKDILQGYGNANKLKQHSRKICIAVFDAATTGRMGVVFYQELSENTYLENIVNWHNDTSYHLEILKKEKNETGKVQTNTIHFIGTPSYEDILFSVYGKPRNSKKDKTYDVLKKKVIKQLLECMFGNFAFPKSLLEMAADRTSRPMSFNDSNGKFSENDWQRSINITCALARKYYKQQKEEIQMDLETSRTDKDYLFGRLLAVADKLEEYALYRAGAAKRATNAVKLMSAFQIKPYSTWGQLYSQLIPYRNQLRGASHYQMVIDEIMELFQNGDYENNSPLSPLYLLGYSAQNRALAKNNKNENMEVNDNGDTAEQN